MHSNTIGIVLGLVVGKPLGILAFCGLAIAFKMGRFTDEMSWRHLVGAGLLAGIGFTMSIFVALLAFEDQGIINSSLVAVLFASTGSAVLGAIWFRFFIPEATICGVDQQDPLHEQARSST